MVNSLYCPLYRGTKWFWTCFYPALSIGVRVFEVWKPFMSAIGRTVHLLWLFWSHKRWTSPPPEQTGIYRFSLLWRAGGFVIVSVIHSAKWEISQRSEFPDVSDSELQVGGWHARFFPLGCSDGLNDMTWLQLSNCTALFRFFFFLFVFQTCSHHNQPALTQATSLEDVHQTWLSSFFSSKRLCTTIFTCAVLLFNTCKQILMWKICGFPPW